MALHNKTTPYLALKKISVKIWTLRDQLEALLESNQHYNSQEKVEQLLKHFNEIGLLVEYFGNEELQKFVEDEGLVLRPPIDENRSSDGTMFLTDIDILGSFFFSRKPFLPGQSILIEFQIPQHFLMSAQILQCKNYNLAGRIISTKRPKYRIQAKFAFLRKGERTLLRKFLQSIHPIPIMGGGNASSEEENSEMPTPPGDDAEAMMAAAMAESTTENKEGGGSDDGGVEDLLKNLAA